MLGGIGYAELVVLGVVAVILFGRKLPEVARNVGNSYAQFRQGLSELQSSMNDVKDDLSIDKIDMIRTITNNLTNRVRNLSRPRIDWFF